MGWFFRCDVHFAHSFVALSGFGWGVKRFVVSGRCRDGAAALLVIVGLTEASGPLLCLQTSL